MKRRKPSLFGILALCLLLFSVIPTLIVGYSASELLKQHDALVASGEASQFNHGQILQQTALLTGISILGALSISALVTILIMKPIAKFSETFKKMQSSPSAELGLIESSPIKEMDDLTMWFNAFLNTHNQQRDTEIALIESESRYHSLFEKCPVPLWEEDFSGVLSAIADLDTGKLPLEEYLIRNPNVVVSLMAKLRVLDINKATLELYKADSKEEVLNNTANIFHGVSIMELREEVLQMASRTQVFEHTLENSTITGEVIGIRLRWSVYPGYEKSMGRVIVSTQDITSQVKAEKLQGALLRIAQAAATTDSLNDLYQSIHQILNTLMPAQNFYIALFDDVSGEVSFPYFVDQFDEPPEPRKFGNGWTEYVIRTGKPLLLSPEIVDYLAEIHGIEEIGSNSVDWLGVPLVVRDKTVGVLAVQTYSTGVRYNEEHRDLLMIVSAQVALSIDRKRAEEDLKQASSHDKLTSLYNRSYFEEEINRLNARRHDPVSMIMIDVDGLKKVNDTYGHSAGDDLLKRTGQILRKAFRMDDMVARIGGDEFAIVLPETNSEAVIRRVERLMECLEETNRENTDFRVGISIGYATSDTDVPLANIIREADQKMYEEKNKKKRNPDDKF